MPKKEFLEIGQIVATHGVRGEVRVQPWCDSPAQIAALHTLYLQEGGQGICVRARAHKQMALVQMDGIQTVEQAEALRGHILYARREDLKLPAGRYFIQDLIGLPVVDEQTGERYGTLTEVSDTGVNNVYHMVTADGREILIPAIPAIIRAVDIDGGEIRIFPMKGLLDDEN